jgi:3' terminal RNA ribose 2'-O-methyltransferase Hen1
MTDQVTSLHQQRLEAVIDVLAGSGATTVLDLGCGPGVLLERLAEMKQFTRITGIDICNDVLREARKLLEAQYGQLPDHITIQNKSFMESDPALTGYDAAVMLETIEHINADRLSLIENAVFRDYRPKLVVITTPNSEYNPLLGVPAHRYRHPDHRFEWPREKFQHWCQGLAKRQGYTVTFQNVGADHPEFGGPTQMAIFEK